MTDTNLNNKKLSELIKKLLKINADLTIEFEEINKQTIIDITHLRNNFQKFLCDILMEEYKIKNNNVKRLTFAYNNLFTEISSGNLPQDIKALLLQHFINEFEEKISILMDIDLQILTTQKTQ